MKLGIPLLILVGGVGVGVGYLFGGGRAQAPDPAAIQQAQTQIIQEAIAPVGEGTEVHTFPDEASLQEFAGLWQQRQALLLRVAMLESYWNGEQAVLGQLNDQLTSGYSLNLEQNYTIDADRRVLIEQETPAAPGEAAEAQAETTEAAAEPASPEAETVVHTFADDEAMQLFAGIWQQRQVLLVRLTVLKSYWDSEQAALDQLNSRFAADYNVDVTRRYRLDEQRRVLIELAALPADAQLPAGQGADQAPVEGAVQAATQEQTAPAE